MGFSTYPQSALQKGKEKLTKEKLEVTAAVSTLTAKVETLTTSLEKQKATEKELQVLHPRILKC